MTLKELGVGKTATIEKVNGEGALRQHLLDMGLIKGAEVTVVKYAPMGDPVEVRIHGYELTLRLSEAENVITGKAHKPSFDENKNIKKIKKKIEHPGIGEGGKFHLKSDEKPLPEGTVLTFALVGNQNCGKTTLFNKLTGSNQHVGNFPGVTVDRKDGVIIGHEDTLITDLPGIYSMSPYSSEEIVTREFLLKDKPKGIINIVDATNIERNLYLTMQLMELNIPIVVALNMMDEVRENDGAILINELEEFLGIPVIPISAAKNEGVEELVNHAIHVAKYQEGPGKIDFCCSDGKESAVHRCLHGIMHLIEDHAVATGIPVRFASSKLAEGDEIVLEALKLSDKEKHILDGIVSNMEEESGMDRSSAIANMRFAYIDKACDSTVIKPKESRERLRSKKIDKILTGKYTGIPAFIAIMMIVFFLTFNVVGAALQNVLALGIDKLTDMCSDGLEFFKVNEVLKSLIVDGVLNGVGSVLSFLPIIVTLFFFLSILEDSGYMARVAFIMDKILRKIGLSGRSIVPMLVGFGCTVPGVMASRTLSSERDRKMTVLLTPFMSCSAKMPVYAFLTAAFFPGKGGIIMVGLYAFGILTGIFTAILLKGTLFKGEAVPFVMELPNYRMPGAGNVLRLLWEKAKDFLQKAFTIIFVATIVIWFLQKFDLRFNLVKDSADSILAVIGDDISPVFRPLGFGDWRISTSLITGFIAKESVVATISVLFGNVKALATAIAIPGAAALLIFCLLYTPCIAAITSVKRELGGKWAVAVVALQCSIAWVMAFIVYNIAKLFI